MAGRNSGMAGCSSWKMIIGQDAEKLNGRSLMGGLDATIDRVDSHKKMRKSVQSVRKACEAYGPGGHFIPCMTYGFIRNNLPAFYRGWVRNVCALGYACLMLDRYSSAKVVSRLDYALSSLTRTRPS